MKERMEERRRATISISQSGNYALFYRKIYISPFKNSHHGTTCTLYTNSSKQTAS
jgi:hypothetical protein